MDSEGSEAANPTTWDVRIARKRQRLPEAEYRAAIARGEIQPEDGTAKVIRGDALLELVKRESGTDECMLAFSCGKDSIAAYLAIREKFSRVVPYYMYGIPDLAFIEESLRYYERELFHGPIVRIPHPTFYLQLANCVYQPPDRVALLHAANLGGYDHGYMRELIVEETKLPERAFIATGLRAYDNTMRRMAIVTYGPINRKSFTFWPIWDMRKATVIDNIKRAGLHLPVDYDMFGRTWDGITASDLIAIRDRFPADYEKILEWFPLADVELYRLERYGVRDVWNLASKGFEPQAKDRRSAKSNREEEARRLQTPGGLQPGRESARGSARHGLGAGECEAGIEGDPVALQEGRGA